MIHTWLLGCEDLFLARQVHVRKCQLLQLVMESKITEIKDSILFLHKSQRSFSPSLDSNREPTSPGPRFLERCISTQNKYDNPYWSESHLARNQPVSLKFDLL